MKKAILFCSMLTCCFFITSCSKTVDETSSINRYAFSPIVAEQVQKIEMRKSKNDCKIVTRQQDIQSCVSTINAFEKTYFVTEPKGRVGYTDNNILSAELHANILFKK